MKAENARRASILVEALANLNDLWAATMLPVDRFEGMPVLTMKVAAFINAFSIEKAGPHCFVDIDTAKAIIMSARKIIQEELREMGVDLTGWEPPKKAIG